MNDAQANSTDPTQPNREQWMVRLAIQALLALTLYGSFVLTEIHEPDEMLRTILFVGGVVFGCLGLLVPWACCAWTRRTLHAPRPHLALASRVLGWFGAGLLPFVVVSASWPVIGLVVLLPLAAHELWRRQLWTVWVWYPVSVGLVPALSAAALLVWHFLIRETVDSMHFDAEVVRWSSHAGTVAAALVVLMFAVRITHETFLFHRSFAKR